MDTLIRSCLDMIPLKAAILPLTLAVFLKQQNADTVIDLIWLKCGSKTVDLIQFSKSQVGSNVLSFFMGT